MLTVAAVVFLQTLAYVREEMKKTSISEQTMISIVWSSVMSSVEWNKKEELCTEQAIKLLKVRHHPMLASDPRSCVILSICLICTKVVL